MKSKILVLVVERVHSMKICLRSAIIAAFLLLIASSANAQTPESNATVYIYKTDHRATFGRFTVPVLLDGREIARLDRNRYLLAKVPPGNHVFTSKDPKSVALTIDLKAGETYYVRISTDGGLIKITPPEFALVSVWQGRSFVADMKPIDQKDITDEAIVQMNETKVPAKINQED
jgi:hypothetical protein